VAQLSWKALSAAVPVTLADIAKRAGVSLATASRVLNGRGRRPVEPRLREQVMAIAEELRYVPNAHAQALARSDSTTVGVVVHDVGDPYFSEIFRGIQRVAVDAGRLVTICNTYRDPAIELEYLALLRSQRVGAIIMTGSGLNERAYTRELAGQILAFTDAGGRAIFIGSHRVTGDMILPDNTGGFFEMTQAILDFGHREIGLICGPALLTTTRDRLDGLCRALATRNLCLDEDHIDWGDFTRDSGAAAALRLLERSPNLTAIMAMNDSMAIGAIVALRERGIDVPGRISVSGFDDIPPAKDVTPALSTVRIPLREMGARAMTLALEAPQLQLRTESIPVQLILRESTKRIS
jgi:LacI family transcriptional regulator